MSIFTGVHFRINCALPEEPGYRRLSGGVVQIRPETLEAIRFAGHLIEKLLRGAIMPEDLVTELGRKTRADRRAARSKFFRGPHADQRQTSAQFQL